MKTQCKIIAKGTNLPNIHKAVGTVLSKASQNANIVVKKAKIQFDRMVTDELEWHRWRGSYPKLGIPGTWAPKAQRISESKRFGYLSTGVPSEATFTGKEKIQFGFGDRSAILTLLTRDGSENLVDLLEYGARAHTYTMTTPFQFAVDNLGRYYFWSGTTKHPGFKGNYFYTRILVWIKDQVGLIRVDMHRNGTKYIRDISTGQITGNLSQVISELIKEK